MKTLLSCRRFAPPRLYACTAAAFAILGSVATAKTVNVDGTNFTTLSAAVAEAYSDADPAVVNLQVNHLPTADLQVVLDRPITINGDAEDTNTDGTPDGDGTPCDLLVNMSGIIALTNANAELGPLNPYNAYITISAPGLVEISNVRIHPNSDGLLRQSGTERELDLISGIRMLRPPAEEDVGTYNLTKVYVSGSDGDGNYLHLDTSDDLYGSSGVMRWGGHNGNNAQGNPLTSGNADGQFGDDAAIQLGKAGGAGIYNATLDHCHAGLSKSAALNIAVSGGTQKVIGGVYGHCNRDGIRVEGTGVTIEGTETDRVRIIRCTNTSGNLSHGLEVAAGGHAALLKYIDVSPLTSANSFNFRSGNTELVEYCRALGKLVSGSNQAVYIDGANTLVGTIRNCTFHGEGTHPSPFNVTANVVDAIDVIDCIFTSLNSGTVNVNTAPVTFTNCALPNDSTPGESLALTPHTGTGATFNPAPVSAAPLYQALLADYDWSDAQNGDGNADVLRPGNSAAYVAAGSNGTPLTGGAGGTEVPVSLSGFAVE